MRGSVIAFITALLTFLAVALEGYEQHVKEHPKPAAPAVQQSPGLQQPQASVTPIYWHDGRTWWCQVGDQKYFWVPGQPAAQDTRRIAWSSPNSNVR
jgi:hypothetical protein